MATPVASQTETRPTFAQRAKAYSVHVYTASGLIFAFLAMAEVCRAAPRPSWVFAWLIAAVLVDSTDGPLARLWQVKRFAPRIDGRKIDDVVDYLTFTFIPLMLVWRMEWIAASAQFLVSAAMIASVMGFANAGAKEEDAGFFLGFPSYWNIYAFYAGLLVVLFGQPGLIVSTVLLAVLTVLTVLPVRFVYPNLAPKAWRPAMLGGAAVWTLILCAMLPYYAADVPAWAFWISLVYPAFYTLVSIYLDVQDRRR